MQGATKEAVHMSEGAEHMSEEVQISSRIFPWAMTGKNI